MQFNEANPLAVSHLGIAARVGNKKAIVKLLKKGRRIDIGDNRGWTPLHEAAAANFIDCLQLLLRKGHKYINQRTMEGGTPLLLACMKQNVDIINLLLEYGADVDLGNNENVTPLHEVCKAGNLNLAEILINEGAKINEIDYSSSSPLHYAVSSGNASLVEFLTRKGCDVNIKDDCWRTPLFIASELGSWDMLQKLLPFYRYLDTRASDGATALMLASQTGNLKVVKELLDHGADPNLAAHDHSMALHLAVHAGHLEVVKLLLDVTNRDKILFYCSHPEARMTTSLSCLAIESQNLDVLKALLESNLGGDILFLPLKFKHTVPSVHTSTSFVYNQTSAISFLLATSFEAFGNEIITYLNLLIDHNFPVNANHPETLPPLVALSKQPYHHDLVHSCMSLLLSKGADLEYTTKCVGVPDPLLAACVTGNCSLFLNLLKAGSSGIPANMLRLLLDKKYSNYARDLSLSDMLQLLLKLGITESALLTHLRSTYSGISTFRSSQIMTLLDKHQVCSLQQLCRVRIRKHIKQPFASSVNELPVPDCMKKYLTYHVI